MQCAETVAFEAAAALEAYDEQLLAMRELGFDPRRVALIQRELRRVCSCSLRLPQLSGPSLALLLAHHRLLADLARSGEGEAGTSEPAELQEVEQCVVTLYRACRELFLATHLH